MPLLLSERFVACSGDGVQAVTTLLTHPHRRHVRNGKAALYKPANDFTCQVHLL